MKRFLMKNDLPQKKWGVLFLFFVLSIQSYSRALEGSIALNYASFLTSKSLFFPANAGEKVTFSFELKNATETRFKSSLLKRVTIL